MITASEKRKENIAEYILYMWQIEDLIRAAGLDMDRIKSRIIDRYASLSDERRNEMTGWYESLIDMMRREGVEKSGHLQMNKNVLSSLVALHQELLKRPEFADYAAEFYRTLPFIVELRSKSGDNKVGEIETCFNALYGLLMLKLAGKEVSADTADAVRQISRFIALLSHDYKLYEADKLFESQKN